MIERSMQTNSPRQQQCINNALHSIHRSLANPITVTQLAAQSSYSVFHFQRLFKAQTGLSVNQYIRQTRLEWVANLLLFHPQRSVAELADVCGFQSTTTFSNRFKSHFGVTPKQWRQHQQPAQAGNAAFRLSSTLSFEPPQIIQLPEQPVIYLRHYGYDHSIRQVWQKLEYWQHANAVAVGEMISLYHSNPLLTPRANCRYVAAMQVAANASIPSGVGRMNIPGGWFLSCRAQGEYGDVLNLWQYLYYQYLPKQALRTLPIPAHAVFYRNHLAGEERRFDMALRLPLQV